MGEIKGGKEGAGNDKGKWLKLGKKEEIVDSEELGENYLGREMVRNRGYGIGKRVRERKREREKGGENREKESVTGKE